MHYFVKRILCFILSVQMCLLYREMCSLYDEHSNRLFFTVLMFGHFVNLLVLEFLLKMTDSQECALLFQISTYA